jgi:pimeloyl-ACP methyl ester carboxylesterase
MARPLLRLAALLGGLGLVYAYPRYQREKQAAVARLRAGSQLFQSPTGALEYAVTGTGQPVLTLHGMGGGYDQGLLLTRPLEPTRYQTIAISRPGHRRTPLSTGRTPASQADAALALLDSLNIERCIVVGLSGGGMASVEFAARHPDRCAALVLLSAHTHFSRVAHAPIWLVWIARVMMALDYPFWLFQRSGLLNLLLEKWQIGTERMQNLDDMGLTADLFQNMFPVSDWREGTINDIEQLFQLSLDTPKLVRCPTLIVQGTADNVVPYEIARLTANAIPGSKLVTIPGGSHFAFATHMREIQTMLDSFFDEVL